MFPNPANYYLPTPEQFETEVIALDLRALAYLNHQLSTFLDDVLNQLLHPQDVADFESFEAIELSEQFDIWVNNLQADQLINLVRWITERIAYLHLEQTRTPA